MTSSTKVAHDILNDNIIRTDDIAISENVDFDGLFLSDSVLKGLKNAGFLRPSPIQLKSIPLGRCGLDLIVQAKAGTGKTCVFTVIALEGLQLESSATQVLVLAPTREIAFQIWQVITSIGSEMKGLTCSTFIGGISVAEDRENLKKCQIAVGTPGRLKFLIEQNYLKTKSIRLFVLDEADQLLDECFQADINWIYSVLPENKQILALSATYPEYMTRHLLYYMRNPTYLRLDVTQLALLGIKQYYLKIPFHPHIQKAAEFSAEAAIKILSSVSFNQCLIFSNLQSGAQSLSFKLEELGWPTCCIAGCLEQKERNEAMARLKAFHCRVLISTDLTSRGIDAENVNLVINLDLPRKPRVYLHRIGRAGRFGSHGAAISLVPGEVGLKLLKRVQDVCNTHLEPLPDPIPNDLVSRPCPQRSVKLDDIVRTHVLSHDQSSKNKGKAPPEKSPANSDTESLLEETDHSQDDGTTKSTGELDSVVKIGANDVKCGSNKDSEIKVLDPDPPFPVDPLPFGETIFPKSNVSVPIPESGKSMEDPIKGPSLFSNCPKISINKNPASVSTLSSVDETPPALSTQGSSECPKITMEDTSGPLPPNGSSECPKISLDDNPGPLSSQGPSECPKISMEDTSGPLSPYGSSECPKISLDDNPTSIPPQIPLECPKISIEDNPGPLSPEESSECPKISLDDNPEPLSSQGPSECPKISMEDTRGPLPPHGSSDCPKISLDDNSGPLPLQGPSECPKISMEDTPGLLSTQGSIDDSSPSFSPQGSSECSKISVNNNLPFLSPQGPQGPSIPEDSNQFLQNCENQKSSDTKSRKPILFSNTVSKNRVPLPVNLLSASPWKPTEIPQFQQVPDAGSYSDLCKEFDLFTLESESHEPQELPFAIPLATKSADLAAKVKVCKNLDAYYKRVCRMFISHLPDEKPLLQSLNLRRENEDAVGSNDYGSLVEMDQNNLSIPDQLSNGSCTARLQHFDNSANFNDNNNNNNNNNNGVEVNEKGFDMLCKNEAQPLLSENLEGQRSLGNEIGLNCEEVKQVNRNGLTPPKRLTHEDVDNRRSSEINPEEGSNMNLGKSLVTNSGKALVKNSGKISVMNSGNDLVTKSRKTLVTNSGNALVTNSGNDLVTNSGNALVTNPGNALVTNSGNTLVTKSGNALVTNSGNALVTKSGNALVTKSGNALVTNSGNALVTKSGNALVTNSGNALVTNSGNTLVTNSGNALVTNSGNALVTNSGNALVTNPGNALVTKSGNALVTKSGNALVTNSGNALVTKSGNALVTNSGNALVTNSGNTLVTNSGNALVTNSGNALVTNSGNALVTNPGNALVTKSGNALVTKSRKTLVTNSGNTLVTNSGNTLVTKSGKSSETKPRNATSSAPLSNPPLPSGSKTPPFVPKSKKYRHLFRCEDDEYFVPDYLPYLESTEAEPRPEEGSQYSTADTTKTTTSKSSRPFKAPTSVRKVPNKNSNRPSEDENSDAVTWNSKVPTLTQDQNRRTRTSQTQGRFLEKSNAMTWNSKVPTLTQDQNRRTRTSQIQESFLENSSSESESEFSDSGSSSFSGSGSCFSDSESESSNSSSPSSSFSSSTSCSSGDDTDDEINYSHPYPDNISLAHPCYAYHYPYLGGNSLANFNPYWMYPNNFYRYPTAFQVPFHPSTTYDLYLRMQSTSNHYLQQQQNYVEWMTTYYFQTNK